MRIVHTFCIDPGDAWIDIAYDSTFAWEGRIMEFTGTLVDQNGNPLPANQALVNRFQTIDLNLGMGGTIQLTRTGNNNEYTGTSNPLEPGTHTMSIASPPGNINLQLHRNTDSVFEVQPREIILTYTVPNYRQASGTTWRDKLLYVWQELRGNPLPDTVMTRQGRGEIRVPILLPYKDALDKQIPIDISLNKLFSDEQASMQVVASEDTAYVFEKKSDAVRVSFVGRDSVQLAARPQRLQSLHIIKRSGRMDFDTPISPEPFLDVRGNLVNTSTSGVDVPLDATQVIFEISTHPGNKFLVNLLFWGWVILLSLITAFLLVVVGILAIIALRNFHEKLSLWRDEISRYSPEDFYASFPESIKKFCKQYTRNKEFLTNPGELDYVKETRALRLLNQKDLSEGDSKVGELEKKIAWKTKKSFLEELKTRVEIPTWIPDPLHEKSRWPFYVPDYGKEVDIVNLKEDHDNSEERNVRVRESKFDHYGVVRLKDGECTFEAKVLARLANSGVKRDEMVQPGQSLAIKSGQLIHFGPFEDESYFEVQVDYGDDRLNVVVHGPMN